ncbi:MAG: DUF2807 domain-containing protein [Saprospiraceae bacterium]|nr:DUF2807 domain-containing protein [Saprospiraceae bacterium]
MKSTLWSLLTFSTLLFFTATACTQNWSLGPGINGEGPKTTKNLDISSFDEIKLNIAADVFVKQGSSQSVKIEAQQNIIDNLKRDVTDGAWKIGFDKNVKNHEPIKIWITVPNIKALGVSGSGSIVSESKFSNLGDLSVAVSGSGDIKFNSDSKNLNAAISGSGNIELAGTTGESTFAISGSGNIKAFDLDSGACNVKISGSGDSSVNASRSLEVAIAGSGDVYYKGQPSVRSKISGSGKVISK